MQLIMGGINGNYLRNITENAAGDTSEVLAAVAYATDASLLFQWCWDKNIPLRYFGRLDDGVAVSTPILDKFLQRRSPRFACKLVEHHHAKVIWWRNFGLYVGSANLTGSAWNKNIEAGCYFDEEEIDDDMAGDLHEMFAVLDQNATPLTEELVDLMRSRSRELAAGAPKSHAFWNAPSVLRWSGCVTTAPKKANDRKKERFLKEWYNTLQELRNIGEVLKDNRPVWLQDSAPLGAQIDQFLHAHYYQRTFKDNKAQYALWFDKNKNKTEAALAEAVQWWQSLSSAPAGEDRMLNEDAPFLRRVFSEEHLDALTYDEFESICSKIHAIRDYARRVRNKSVGLVDDGTRYTIPDKVKALSSRIWADRSAGGKSVVETIGYILYGGSLDLVPERLWDAIHEPNWRIEGLGISALGELVGWALPDKFPPRNGRTSKSLKSLGYDVVVHVG